MISSIWNESGGEKRKQYPVSHNRRERRLYRDLKGGQCEMSAVTLAPILLWLRRSVISSKWTEHIPLASGCVPQPAEMTSLSVNNNNKQRKTYSLAGAKWARKEKKNNKKLREPGRFMKNALGVMKAVEDILNHICHSWHSG